jgi:hypothetical protein
MAITKPPKSPASTPDGTALLESVVYDAKEAESTARNALDWSSRGTVLSWLSPESLFSVSLKCLGGY